MNIIGKSECTASQMAQYLINKNPNAKSWALEYAQLYLEEGKVEGVRGDGAWIQSCKETSNFKFSGGTAVTFDQNNFCGLGVTSKGMKGHSFETPRLGIRAQIQHLKGYATATPLINTCIDPRYKYINPKGKAPCWEDLAGKWAVPGYDTSKATSLEEAMTKKIGYGFDIISGIEQMKKITTVNSTIKDNNTNNTEEISNMRYTNSPLVSYTKISPNKTSPRNHVIDTITIHCVVGQVTVERLGDIFASTSRQASSNYGIGKDGKIGMYVEEKDRSWCSSNSINDHRAITIEVASDTTHPYTVTDKALNSLIKLCADICKRNNIKKLVWSTNKNDRVNHLNGCNMTVHRDFANKDCPGDYLYNKHGYIANEVNKLLGSYNDNYSSGNTVSTKTYTVVKGDTLSKIGTKTGVAWKTIAKLNGIKFPYAIKVGQVLKLSNANQGNTSSSVSNVKYMYNGLDYSPVFNPTYYANTYSDIKKAFGNNSVKLFNHFKAYGMKEGRQASENFNVNVYKNRYMDLQKAFGINLPKYYEHYCKFGAKEGRSAI